MDERKLKQLFAAARRAPAPAPAGDFAAQVLGAIHREPPALTARALSIFESLNAWFPRLALTAAAVIVLCVAADCGLTAAGLPGLGDSAAQAASQCLFDPEEL
jgi:hypothetical protein